MSGTTSVRYLSPGEERHHHNITIVPTCDVETKNWWFQGFSRILELFRHRIRAKYWALVIMVKLICKCMQALVMTSVRYLSPEEEISHHNITIVQTWVETKKLMVALPSSSPCPQICHPWSGPISRGDISQSEASMVTNDQSEARGLQSNIFLWQSQICSHECLHLTALRADTLTNEWGKGLSWLFIIIGSNRSSMNVNVCPAVCLSP